MNLWNKDQIILMSDCNKNWNFPISYLESPFDDLYVFEECETFSQSHIDSSSFASSNSQDDHQFLHHHFHVSSSSFDSSNHQEIAHDIHHHESSSCHEFNGECSWSWDEEFMGKENKKSKSTIVSKKRIKWTEELHKKFIDCVDQLGGIQKATPKQLLHLMKTKGLTLIHVKSHLQKYRISHHIQEFSKGESERETKKELLQPNQNIGKQLMEVLRQQLHTQTSLNEQLEVQKNLISAIEEQMEQLRGILELKRKPVVLGHDKES